MSATANTVVWPTREELRGIGDRFDAVYAEIDGVQARLHRALDAGSVEYEAEDVLKLPPVSNELVAEMLRFHDRIQMKLDMLVQWAADMKAWPTSLVDIQDNQEHYAKKAVMASVGVGSDA